MEKNLTTGSVLKNVVSFSLPFLLSYFLQTLYGMADLFIIGQYEGVASTTAVSVDVYKRQVRKRAGRDKTSVSKDPMKNR